MMFQGSASLVMDAKGRLTVPARHRDDLMEQCKGQLKLARSLDGCLQLFPLPAWDAYSAKVAEWPMSAAQLKRIVLGHAADIEMDGNGRILVPPPLRAAGGLVKDVMMLGMGKFFELWDAEQLAIKDKEALAAGIPESLANFTF